MNELGIVAVSLAIVLTIVTVVGHVSWLFFAAIFRAVFGASFSDQGSPSKLCPSCGRQTLANGQCNHCGRVPAVSAIRSERDELHATARQLSRLYARGHLTHEQCTDLLKVVESDLARFGVTLPREVWPTFQKAQPASLEPAAQERVAPEAPQPALASVEEAASSGLVLINDDSIIEAVMVSDEIPAVAVGPISIAPAIAARELAAPARAEKITPSRTLADMLQGFMEESNIRWGEVIAGLVIVISAIGLVISLRATLKHIPYFPALLFLLFTVSFHGAGLYTLRRWKLAAVSRAILIIALLLVPLSFSAGVILSGQGEVQRPLTDPLLITALLVGLSVFGWVTYSGSRELTGEGAPRLTLAVLGCCLAQVLINRGSAPGISAGQVMLLASLPLGSFLIAAIGQIWRAEAWRRLSSRRLEQILIVLGISLFSLVPPLAILVFKTEPRRWAFDQLSPLLSLVVCCVLAVGLLIQRRTTARALALQRTAGTALAILSGAALLALWTIAWPEPGLMLGLGLLTSGLLLALAMRTGLPVLHAAGASSLTLSALVAFFWWQGLVQPEAPLSLQWAHAVLLGRTSLLLTLVAAAIAGIGAWRWTQRDRSVGLTYLATAAVLSLLSLSIASWSGFARVPAWTGDGDLSGPLFAGYALVLFAVAFQAKNKYVVSAAMALAWLALVQLLHVNDTAREQLVLLRLLPERPVLVATILAASLFALLALGTSRASWRLATDEFAKWQQSDTYHGLILPLTYGAATAILTATPFILWVLPGRFAVHAVYAGMATLVWAVICISRRWPEALATLQAMAAVVVAFAIAACWPVATTADAWWLVSGRHLQAQLLALAISAGVWSIVRRLSPSGTVVHQLLHPEFVPCDHILLGLAVGLLTLLGVSSALPGISWELGLHDVPVTRSHLPWLDSAHSLRLVAGWGAVVAALVLALVDRITPLKLVGLSLAGWAGAALIAQSWEAQSAVASAARWSCALYGGLLVTAYLLRRRAGAALQARPWLRWRNFTPKYEEWFRYQPLVLGIAPAVILTILAVAQHATGKLMHVPVAGSFFDRIGPTASYAGPLLIGVTTCLALAVHLRQPGFALGGGLLFQLAANLALILHLNGKPAVAETVRMAEGLQWNLLAAASYALLWLLVAVLTTLKSPHPSIDRFGGRPRSDVCFKLFVAAASILLLINSGAAVTGIVQGWRISFLEAPYLGGWANLLAGLLLVPPILAAVGVTTARRTWHRAAGPLAILPALAVPLIALRADLMSLPGRPSIVAYYTLEIGWLFVAIVVAASLLIAHWPKLAVYPLPRACSRWTTPYLLTVLLSFGLVGLTGWQVLGGPGTPWYLGAIVGGTTVALLLLALAHRSQPLAHTTLILALLAMIIPWATGFWWRSFGNSTLLVAINTCLFPVLLVGGWWQAVEMRYQHRWQQSFAPHWVGPRAGQAAAFSVTLVLFFLSGVHLFFVNSNWYQVGLPQVDLGLIALVINWLVLGIIAWVSLWDRRAELVFQILLIWGWTACALALAPLPLAPLPMFAFHALAVTTVIAVAGHLWSYGANLATWGDKLGISDTIGGLSRIGRWLPTVTLLVGSLASAFIGGALLNLSLREHRVLVAFTPALMAYAVACLAQLSRAHVFRVLSLLLVGLSCVYLGWADLNPGFAQLDWLTRAFRLLMVLSVVTLGCGLILPRFIFRQKDWQRASLYSGTIVAALAVSSLVALLILEVALFKPGVGTGSDHVQVAAVAVLLVIFIVALISLALSRDLQAVLPQRQRTWFVYGAQLVAGLLFAHLYLCKPDWFDGLLKPYWPFIVIAIAFAGVGLGELFWRLRLTVLAEPFERTASFLPLLPILGMWIVTPRHDQYTLLLFAAGMLYLILSLLRKSWAAAIAAAVAGNGAIWSFLHQSDWMILQHPQFWLIPPAVSVLIAAQLNYRRLSSELLSAIRYASLIVIYISSTFEIFLDRASLSLWPPIILTCLSLSGALAGVLLRIRAFLYLGSVFTLLAMVSMVWHAARAIEHVWPWWAFGIGMGIAILAMLAFFEKNRSQVQALVTRLRQWDQ